tara:strand:- start:3814 stop:4203 length:390 start_codon:yes stop_codon:yes gene_type:complete
MILFLMSMAFADTPTYTVVEKDQPAPFAGYILTPDALKLLSDAAKEGMSCPAEIDYQVGLMEAKKQKEIKMIVSDYELEVGMLQDEATLQKERIEKLEKLKKPFNRGVWVTVGIAIGVGTTIAIANAVN